MTFTRSGAPFELAAEGKHEGSIGQLRELVDNPTLDGERPDPDYDGDPARLVGIDPLRMPGVRFDRVKHRRAPVFAPLQRIATETGCALVLTHHTVASGKVTGSKGLTDAARLVYWAKRDRENPGIRVLEIDKSNILANSDPVRYTIHGEGADTFVRWLDRAELTARRTAWRVPEPGPVATRRQLVTSWLEQSGGSLAGCVEATRLPQPVCEGILGELQASGVAASRRKLALRRR